MTYIELPEGNYTPSLPFFFAIEEYVAKHYTDDEYFFIWRVPPTVMVGRNQLVEKEVNSDYCKAHGVQVFRRKSGGGCVYADDGCMQFSYISGEDTVADMFSDYVTRIVEVLRALGIDAEKTGRNDITVAGRKVAGHAFYKIPGRSVLHNTMLYSTNLEELTRCLTPPDEKLISKGIDSVRQRVTNLCEHTSLSLDELATGVRRLMCGNKMRTLTETDMKGVAEIEKVLASDEFTYGNNPKYTVIKQRRMEDVGTIEARVEVKGNKIKSMNLLGDFFVLGDIDGQLIAPLRNVPFERNAVAAALADVQVPAVIRNLRVEGLLNLLFGRSAHVPKPSWLRINPFAKEKFGATEQTIKKHGLHTICSSGLCPNRAECWAAGTATLMIGGNICTRSCRFCNTHTGRPLPLDPKEPQKVADSVKKLGLRYAVITSVDRDDLPDLGANHWAETVKAIREVNPDTKIELLIPDFQGRMELVDKVLEACPDVVGHNLETVRRLTPAVRSVAKYDQSLAVLKHITDRGFTAKTGIMVGLGETQEEVEETLRDACQAGCKVVTVGQYLQPSYNHYPVVEYIHPTQFAEYKEIGEAMGIRRVVSGPLVRSSYHAAEAFDNQNSTT